MHVDIVKVFTLTGLLICGIDFALTLALTTKVTIVLVRAVNLFVAATFLLVEAVQSLLGEFKFMRVALRGLVFVRFESKKKLAI
jgi:hypothetical protein